MMEIGVALFSLIGLALLLLTCVSRRKRDASQSKPREKDAELNDVLPVSASSATTPNAAAKQEGEKKPAPTEMPALAASSTPVIRAINTTAGSISAVPLLHIQTQQQQEQQQQQQQQNPIGIHSSVFFSLLKLAPDQSSLTTEQLCAQVIKPATSARQCAYIDILQEESPQALGPATCFISHAWKCPFNDITDAVSQFEQKHPNTYYWFDLFTNNQHKATALPFEWWCTTFKESIRGIGHVMLVMSPWDKPVPLTRAWCLFEMYSSIDVDADMTVAIPSAQIASFRAAITKNYNTITKTLIALDGEKAEAGNPADKEQIFQVVRERISGGFATLNNTVKGHLREWYLNKCVAMAEEAEDANSLYNIGVALRDYGDSKRALEVLERCLTICRETVGENHPQTGRTYNVIGIIYRNKLDFDKALEYQEKDLAIKLATLGENHADTAITYNAIGNAYRNKGEYNKALQYHERELAIKLATIGENHPSTALAFQAIGLTYKNKGEFDKALENYEKCLGIQLATLGENHPDVGITYNTMGNAYRFKGELSKALQYHERELANTLATLGENHADTAITYNNIGNVYQQMGEHDKALQSFEKSLAIKIATVGESSYQTGITYSAMGLSYVEKGDLNKALEYFKKELAINLATRGESHADTLATFGSMGMAYERLGDKDMAREYLGKYVRIGETTLGKGNSNVEWYRQRLQALE